MKLDEKTRNCLASGRDRGWVSDPMPSGLKQQQPNNFYFEKMEIVKAFLNPILPFATLHVPLTFILGL